MRNLPYLTARLFNTPLMLRPEAANSLAGAFMHILSGDTPATVVIGAQSAIERQPEPFAFAGNVPISRFKDKPYAVTDEGIALLSVTGPLVQRAGQMTPDCAPMASYQRLQSRLEAMQADPDVKGILLEWDSPGGEAAGNMALASRLLSQRGNKPVWSYVNEVAASAAYALAASTDRILMPASGLVGSIGVVMLHMDQSERDKKQGLSYTYIYAGERKVDMNSHSPLSAEARATANKMVQAAYDQFTAHVAASRSISQQAVRDTQAGIFSGSEARQIGLADDIASFDQALAELTAHVQQRGTQFSATGGRMAAPISAKGETMSLATPAATLPAHSASPPQGSQASADQRDVGAAASEQQLASARADGMAAGQTAERQRIQGILNHSEATNRQQLARTLAFTTDMAVDQAGIVLAAAAQEAAPVASAALSPLAAAMAQVPNPKVVAAAPAAPDDASPQSLAANVVSLFNQNQGVKHD